ncbi:MAG: alanine racemase [Gemmatimonadaceae bacterium]|nr:alanine racemase [Gemmatimonadaceae bacterium]
MQRPHDSIEPIYPQPSTATLRAWVDVDLDAVRRNALKLRARAGVPLVAMVKADGYGIGMLPVVRALGGTFRGDHVHAAALAAPWAFGIATLEEAASLRQAGCTARVLCTTPLTLRDLPEARALDVRPALHRPEDITAWSALGGGPWHLSIDTGMSRAGVRWDEVEPLDLVLREHPPEGVFTHFHSAEIADGSREAQEIRFAEALRRLGTAVPTTALIHCDNSAAIAARGPSPGQLARPGIGLYGSTATTALDLEQVVHLRTRIVDLRLVHDGETVSYGATYHANGTRHIATVAIGYADGYRRALSNKGMAIVRGMRVPVVGTVTMDMTMLDVTTLAGRCAVGDTATFIGRDGGDCLWTDDVAALAGLSPYELLVGLRLRAPRRYFEKSDADRIETIDR